MHVQQGTLPRTRSAFTAAFLSLVFPGLGHAYGGALQRALGFAALPLLALSLIAGLATSLRIELLGLLVQPWMLILILIGDVLFLGYRAASAIDAWRVAIHLNAMEASAGGRLGRPKLQTGIGSLVGLALVLAVMAGGHAAVAYYGLQAYELVTCVFDSSGENACGAGSATGADATGGTAADSGSGPDADVSTAPSDGPVTAPPDSSPAATAAAVQPWNGKDRVNILLVGADQRPEDNTFNTDTMIVVSIDPATRQVAMLQVPRDTVDVPLPPGPPRSVFGSVYRGKINSLWTQALARPDLWPGSQSVRGATALKEALGYLYGLQIRWYVQVNFDGFRQVVDTLGGVTIDVQTPVFDDSYPSQSGRLSRVYIPAGIAHFSGEEALVYARSRHTSTDFDRGARQQRVLVSLKEQTDFGTVIGRLPALIGALKSSVKTDIPVGQLGSLVALASTVDTTNIRSFVFAPPLYQQEILSGDPRGYVIIPYVDRIRAAVESAFVLDPAAEADRTKIAAENATVWVLNGTGKQGQASAIAGYLEARGVNAIAPGTTPASKPKGTRIVVYNGAEARLTETIKLLEAAFGVTVTPLADPEMRADIVITTGKASPDLTPPPGP